MHRSIPGRAPREIAPLLTCRAPFVDGAQLRATSPRTEASPPAPAAKPPAGKPARKPAAASADADGAAADESASPASPACSSAPPASPSASPGASTPTSSRASSYASASEYAAAYSAYAASAACALASGALARTAGASSALIATAEASAPEAERRVRGARPPGALRDGSAGFATSELREPGAAAACSMPGDVVYLQSAEMPLPRSYRLPASADALRFDGSAGRASSVGSAEYPSSAAGAEQLPRRRRNPGTGSPASSQAFGTLASVPSPLGGYPRSAPSSAGGAPSELAELGPPLFGPLAPGECCTPPRSARSSVGSSSPCTAASSYTVAYTAASSSSAFEGAHGRPSECGEVRGRRAARAAP